MHFVLPCLPKHYRLLSCSLSHTIKVWYNLSDYDPNSWDYPTLRSPWQPQKPFCHKPTIYRFDTIMDSMSSTRQEYWQYCLNKTPSVLVLFLSMRLISWIQSKIGLPKTHNIQGVQCPWSTCYIRNIYKPLNLKSSFV